MTTIGTTQISVPIRLIMLARWAGWGTGDLLREMEKLIARETIRRQLAALDHLALKRLAGLPDGAQQGFAPFPADAWRNLARLDLVTISGAGKESQISITSKGKALAAYCASLE